MEELALRDISKHLGLTWSVRDELEAMEACTLVSVLRAKDERFQPNFIDMKQVKTTKTRLKKYCALLDRLKSYEKTNTLESWNNACVLCQTNDKVFSKQLLECCQIEMAKKHAQLGALVDSADLLKQILLNNGKLGQAWVERGKVFLAMQVPLLAQVHFAHPTPAIGIDDIVLLQQRTQDLITKHSLEMTLQQRRQALEHIPPLELFARAELLLWQEEFAASAAIYYAACLHVCNPEQRVQCLLNISACWRRKRDEVYADRCIQLCNLAWRMDKDGKNKKLILMERARAWLLMRQFAFAMDDLNQIHFVGNEEEEHDDDEVKKLKQRCNKPVGVKTKSMWMQIRVVIVVTEQHQQSSTRHELFGGIPNEPIVSWNEHIRLEDLRQTNLQIPEEEETAIPCVYVGPNFVSFPVELDYFRDETLDEDVLWTWGKLQSALEGIFQPQKQQESLSALLLKQTPLHKFTASPANRVDLPYCTCAYIGEFTDWEFAMDNELQGISLPVGKRTLNLEQTTHTPAIFPPPSSHATTWILSCAVVLVFAIGWAAIVYH